MSAEHSSLQLQGVLMRKRSSVSRSRMIGSRKLVLFLSSCVPALMLATPAMSAEADAAADTAADPAAAAPASTDAGEILVTGFRQSIESALEKKRNDIRVTDGISAEDIGKFPAQNVTEAIQRISGVQMSNINGRGSTISIRGLGAQYARTTINGQTFASADFKDGFRYDIIQTDLANSIQVIKSPTADMDTGGLSGTVNIETLHPLDYHGPSVILGAKLNYNDYRESATPKLSAAYIDKFAGDTLGVMVNVGYQELNDRGDYLFIDRWYHPDTSDFDSYVPKRLRYRRIDRDTKQFMASGTLQWQPSSEFEALFQGEYSQDHTTYDTLQLVNTFGSTDDITVNSVENGVATNITADSWGIDSNDQLEKRNLTSQAYTATANWTPDGWKVHAVAHYTVGKADLYEWASILGVNVNTPATLDISDANNVSFVSDHSLTDGAYYNDTSNYSWYAFYDGAYHFQTSKELAGQLDVTKEMGSSFLKSITAGVKYRHESFATDAYRHDRDADPTDTDTYPELSLIPDMTGSGGVLVNNFLDGAMSIPSSFLSVNANTWQSIFDESGLPLSAVANYSDTYRVDRYIPAAYIMADIDTTLFGLPLRGNVGGRYEYTWQDVRMNEVDGDGALIGPKHVKQSYGNFLPSASFALDVTDKLVARVALAKVLIRPLLNSDTVMADTLDTGVSNSRPYVSYAGGEASLKPMTANQADIGLEYYWGRGNSVSLTGFYKAIKNGTYTEYYCPSSYNGVELETIDSQCQSVDESTDYNFSRVLNDSSTIKLKGVELAWSQNFDSLLPIPGFGITGNITAIDAGNSTVGDGYHLSNLSKLTWNLTPYWEHGKYSVRVSVNHRSSYEQDYSDSFFAGYGETHTVRARTQVDLALGYSINDTFSLAAGIINLNNTHEDAYYQNASTFQMASRTGRNGYVSLTGRF